MVFYLPGMPLQSYYFPDKQKISHISPDRCPIRKILLYDFIFHIYKLCIPWQPYQLNGSNGAVTLFGNNDLGNILFSVSL